MKIDSSDVWFARTQPYGFWRARSPLVKLVPVVLLLVASTIWNPALLLQGVVLGEFMLIAPFNSRSSVWVVGINVATASCLLALLTPSIGLVPYADLQSNMTFEIPRYVTVDGFFSLCIILMMISLFRIRRAYTSRDFAYFVDFIPGKRLRGFVGETLYAHTYGLLQLPRLIAEVDTSMRSRGISRPSFFRFFLNPLAAIDDLGLWSLCVFRQMQEMAILVEFYVMSRIRLETRESPIGRQMSQADVAMILIFVFGILTPWAAAFVV